MSAQAGSAEAFRELSRAWGDRARRRKLDANSLAGWTPCLESASLGDALRQRTVVASRTDSGKSIVVLGKIPDDVSMTWAYALDPKAATDWAYCEEAEFDAWLDHWQQSVSALTLNRAVVEPVQSADRQALDVTLVGVTDEQSFVVRFVSSLLFDALRTGASDAHLEIDQRGLTAKLRMDGILVDAGRLDGREHAQQVVSRIKVLSELDISEQRLPQDGRFTAYYRGRRIDIRVSIMPSVFGEDAVLRILDRQHLADSLQGLSLQGLGFDGDTVDDFKALCRRPYGLVLVTGPTGSGKTTTLYAALSETRDPREKIITIEDPVEYQIDGILQIPVNEKKGLSFARGLRSILRHDPDRILVGEIRDRETAEIAVQAALTGHLVYTSVHANDAFDVLGRFTQFGLDLYSVASALSGVLAQRLVRVLCLHCREAGSGDSFHALAGATQRGGNAISSTYRSVGCERCRGTGYSGRKAIGELMLATPDIKTMIARGASAVEIRGATSSEGRMSMRDQGMQLVLRGDTTLEEVDRVTLAA